MIFVIQCAARKHPDAGHLRRHDGQKVLFVARPDEGPYSGGFCYARPDDVNEDGKSWRNLLLEYNACPENNSLGLLPAWQLYRNPAYAKLVRKFGIGNIYILSAGWGLIGANFLTPAYDITFSASAESHKRRRKKDRYNDFEMLPPDVDQPVLFLGGKDYIPLFCLLTDHISAQRKIIYNASTAPDAPGCVLKRFNTTARTNWHYKCAQAIVEDQFSVT